MSLEDIKGLPVAEWASDDCVLLLWATDPLLERAFEVIRSWGFTYKIVGFYWAKLNKTAAQRHFDEKISSPDLASGLAPIRSSVYLPRVDTRSGLLVMFVSSL
jgi:hypothetical protein